MDNNLSNSQNITPQKQSIKKDISEKPLEQTSLIQPFSDSRQIQNSASDIIQMSENSLPDKLININNNEGINIREFRNIELLGSDIVDLSDESDNEKDIETNDINKSKKIIIKTTTSGNDNIDEKKN